MNSIEWTVKALASLDKIDDFNLKISRAFAESVRLKIHIRIDQLKDFPHSGPIEHIILKKQTQIHYLVEGHYKIFYTFDKNKIFILTVFDTRQNPKKLRKEIFKK